MTDKEYEFQKKRIRRLIKKWIKPIGLNWWKIDIEYDRGIRDDNSNPAYSPKVVKGKWVTMMETNCDPYYLKANIVCYLPDVARIEDEELEETFLHELMHIFLSPMKSKQKAKEEELVATKLAQAFIWSKHVKHGKKTS